MEMNDNESAPPFSPSSLPSNTNSLRGKKAEGREEEKYLKDLTAKTINIYYQDIKTKNFFIVAHSLSSTFFKCFALINSLHLSTLFIILKVSTKSLHESECGDKEEVSFW